MSGIRFPQLPAAYLGPQQAYTKLGMNTISNKDPLIHCTSGAIEVSYPAVTFPLFTYFICFFFIDCALWKSKSTLIYYLFSLYKFLLICQSKAVLFYNNDINFYRIYSY